MPVTIPSGRRRPPVAPAVSTTGSTGNTHGESAVAAPANSAKSASSTIPSTVSYSAADVSDATVGVALRASWRESYERGEVATERQPCDKGDGQQGAPVRRSWVIS